MLKKKQNGGIPGHQLEVLEAGGGNGGIPSLPPGAPGDPGQKLEVGGGVSVQADSAPQRGFPPASKVKERPESSIIMSNCSRNFYVLGVFQLYL